MPYTQEQYQRAKSAISSGSIPPDKLTHVAQRIAEFEGKPSGMGNLRAMEGSGGALEVKTPEKQMPTLGEVDSQFGPSYLAQSKSPTAEVIRETGAVLNPEAMEVRRKQVDWTKKLTTEPSLKNASKLKVFDDPPDYDPPKDLPGGFGGNLPKATTSYFEPSAGEFRAVMMANPRVKAALHEEYPDPGTDVEKLDEQSLEKSAAYAAYADARWQRALADSLRTKTPITRVQFSDKTNAVDPTTGERKLNLTGHASQLMDKTMALGSGALQGATGGAWDLLMSLGGDTNKRRAQVAELTGANIEPLETNLGTDVRDAGRGSRDRNPITAMGGTVAGALDPRQLPGKLASGLGKVVSKVGSPKSLPGRTATSAGIGAATTVIDENMRAAADLAADALDADKSARETALSLVTNLPGVNPVTAGVGAAGGAVLDLAGAGFGAVKRTMTQGDRLRAPLKHFEESGGHMGPLMGPRLEPGAKAARARAEALRTQPQDLLAEETVQPLAQQMLKRQEASKRTAELETNIAQAKLEGRDLPTAETAAAIRAEAMDIDPITDLAKNQREQLLRVANRLASKESVTAADLDKILDQLDLAAKHGSASKAPVAHYNNAGRLVRGLRDKFAQMDDEVTAVEFAGPEHPGPLGRPLPEPVLPEDTIVRQFAGIRDDVGNITPTEGYSRLKAQQYKDRALQKFREARVLGRDGDTTPLRAEPAEVSVEDRGLFNVEEPSIAARKAMEKQPPKVALKLSEHEAIKNRVRKLAQPDDLELAREVTSLAKEAGPEVTEKIRFIKQLDDSKRLQNAMAGAVENLGNHGYLNLGMLKKLGFRSIPTLKSLSGGLPTKPTTPVASDKAVARLREFIPEWEALHLRGGKPARVVGAAREREEGKESKFSPEEKEFWLKVIEKIVEQQKPQKVATQ